MDNPSLGSSEPHTEESSSQTDADLAAGKPVGKLSWDLPQSHYPPEEEEYFSFEI